jgi:copper chaperone CopZ
MPHQSGNGSVHPHLHVVHATPGRVRLRAHNIKGKPQRAEEVERRLSAVPGVKHVEANPTTGSITVHYHRSLLQEVESVGEVAASLGLIASGLGPEEVEALFKVIGVSPEDIGEAFGPGKVRSFAIALAIFAAGFLLGRRLPV